MKKLAFGFLVNTYISTYEATILKGIIKYLQEKEIDLKCFTGGAIKAPDPFDYEETIRNIIQCNDVDALIVVSGTLLNNFMILNKSYEAFERYLRRVAPIPCVSLGLPLKEHPSVVVDNRSGMRAVLEHFIHEHGRKRILFIKGPKGIYDADERFETYKEVLANSGLVYDETLILNGSFTNISGGGKVLEPLLQGVELPFDAIVAANDFLAISAFKVLQEYNIKVPGDVIIAGFDNTGESIQFEVPLTTVHQPFFELGYTGAGVLHRVLLGQEEPPLTALPTRMVVRNSCGCEKRISGGKGKDVSPHYFSIGVEEDIESLAISQDDIAPDFRKWTLKQNEAIRLLYPQNTYSQLKETLNGLSSGLGIRFGYFVLDDENLHGVGEETRIYNLVKDNRTTKPGCDGTLVSPMYDKRTCFGFLVLGFTFRDIIFYDVLSTIIIGVVKRILLFSRIQKYTLELEDKVQERTNQLEEANKQKTNFFVNLAHETKTPLTLIKNYLEKYITDHGLSSDLKVIQRNVDMLLRNMVNFLDAEKLKKGQVFYDHAQNVELSDLIENKIQLFNEIAAKKGLAISSHIEKGVIIRADPFAVDRIINNLLDNAIKYSKPGGEVNIRLESGEENIILLVRDTGIGMSTEQVEHIYMPYYQFSGKKRNIRGIGMGLYIVKRILDSLGAVLQVQSEMEKGSEFIIKMPKKPISMDDNAAAEKIILSKPIDEFLVMDRLNEPPVDSAKNTLLIVDDNTEMLFFLQSCLKKAYNVHIARSGQEAIFKLNLIQAPDLILSDVIMNDMNGHELFLKLKESSRFNDIPFIFVSARKSPGDKIKGLHEGAIDYIEKPFLIEEIEAKIEAVINNRKKMKDKLIEKVKKQILSSVGGAKYTFTNLPSEGLYKDYKVTPREREVLEFVLQGYYNKEISDQLGISMKTVEFHLYNVYQKLGVQNRVELTNFIKWY